MNEINGTKQCFITFKDGSSTWEFNGATYDLTADNDIVISWTGNEHNPKSNVKKMSEEPGEIKGHLLYMLVRRILRIIILY